MKNQDSNDVMGRLQLSELNKLTEEEALFESLRPSPYMDVLYYLAFIAIGAFLKLKTDLNIDGLLILGALFIPLIIIDGYRRVNRRIDALYHLVRKKYCGKN